MGATHSHYPLLVSDDILLETDAMSGLVEVDTAGMRATLRGGTRIADLGRPLREHGLALPNQGDIDRQSIAGAVATGTHGTGPTLRNLSAAVVGARIVGADGEVVECDATREPDLFQIVRLSLGAAGIVCELTLSLRPAYRLREKMWVEDLDRVLDRIDELAAATRHFEFFWLPGKTRTACKSLEETDEAPQYPLAEEGARVAWSDEVLANVREDRHSEMEYSVPAQSGPDCLRELRDMIARDFPDLAWPIEYRHLAADEVWLSTAYQRPTATISIHQGVDRPDEPLFRACEAVFARFEGRPHWGKVHYRSGEELAAMHPRWHDWWEIRDRYDPDGRFLNPRLRELRAGAMPSGETSGGRDEARGQH
jgi:FAD/FMN-containing dehydrogenase